MMEILKSYFDENEVSKVEKEIEKDQSFKEKYEKIKNNPDYKMAQLADRIDTKTESNFEKRFEAFKKAVLDAETIEKNQKPTKQETNKAKKEAEEKWFSWERITKLVEEKWGWFSWAWISAWIWAFFSSLFSNIFKWLDKKVDDATDYLKGKVEWLTSGVTKESKWEFKNNEYISHSKKFNIKFKSNEEIDTIKINWKEYQLDWKFKLEEENWEYNLVSTT